MKLNTVPGKLYFHDVRAFRSIGCNNAEIIMVQGYAFSYWTVIATGSPAEALNQSLQVFQHTPLLSANGDVLLEEELHHRLRSLIENTPVTTEKIVNYPLYPFYDKEQRSPVTSAIETFFPEDGFMCGMRIGATALEIHDIRIFQEKLIAELQRINRDWFNLSTEQAIEIISSALHEPTFHSELFQNIIPQYWD